MFSWLKDSIKQLLSLRRDVDALTKDFVLIRHEWQDWFEKYSRLHARIARRQQREELLREQETQAEGENGGTPHYEPGPRLSPTQTRIQQQILARRARQANERSE